MQLDVIPTRFSVCKVADYSRVDWSSPFVFIGQTDEERSLVCDTALVPPNTLNRDDGWRALRICGVLDFSLIGILSRLTAVLAAEKVGIFAVSTYNTDYVLVKEADWQKALAALTRAGYEVPAE